MKGKAKQRNNPKGALRLFTLGLTLCVSLSMIFPPTLAMAAGEVYMDGEQNSKTYTEKNYKYDKQEPMEIIPDKELSLSYDSDTFQSGFGDLSPKEKLDYVDENDVSHRTGSFILRSRTPVKLEGYGGEITDKISFENFSVTFCKVIPGKSLSESMDEAEEIAKKEVGVFFEGSVITEPDVLYSLSSAPNDSFKEDLSESFLEPTRGFNAMGAWDLLGSHDKVKVGIIDSGVGINNMKSLVDLKDGTSSVVHSARTGDDAKKDLTDYRQKTYHGTTIAGVISSLGNNGKGVVGIASGLRKVDGKSRANDIVELYSYNAADKPDGKSATPSLSASSILKGINALHKKGCRVINISAASVDGENESLRSAIDSVTYAKKNPTTVVTAAGAESKTTTVNKEGKKVTYISKTYPSDYANTLSVIGATRKAEGKRINGGLTKWTSSSYGSFKNLSAYAYAYTPTKKPVKVKGTSYAAPQISAIAAMMYYVKPELTPSQVKNIMYNSSDNTEWSNELGYGMPDAKACVINARNLRNVPVKAIRTNASVYKVGVGATSMIQYALLPADTKRTYVSFDVAKPKIASVDSSTGLIKGLKKGITKVTMKAGKSKEDKADIKQTFTIQVGDAPTSKLNIVVDINTRNKMKAGASSQDKPVDDKSTFKEEKVSADDTISAPSKFKGTWDTKKKGIKLSWSKVKNAKSYMIQSVYSDNMNKTHTINLAFVKAQATNKMIYSYNSIKNGKLYSNKLEKGKKYKFKIVACTSKKKAPSKSCSVTVPSNATISNKANTGKLSGEIEFFTGKVKNGNGNSSSNSNKNNNNNTNSNNSSKSNNSNSNNNSSNSNKSGGSATNIQVGTPSNVRANPVNGNKAFKVTWSKAKNAKGYMIQNSCVHNGKRFYVNRKYVSGYPAGGVVISSYYDANKPSSNVAYNCYFKKNERYIFKIIACNGSRRSSGVASNEVIQERNLAHDNPTWTDKSKRVIPPSFPSGNPVASFALTGTAFMATAATSVNNVTKLIKDLPSNLNSVKVTKINKALEAYSKLSGSDQNKILSDYKSKLVNMVKVSGGSSAKLTTAINACEKLAKKTNSSSLKDAVKKSYNKLSSKEKKSINYLYSSLISHANKSASATSAKAAAKVALANLEKALSKVTNAKTEANKKAIKAALKIYDNMSASQKKGLSSKTKKAVSDAEKLLDKITENKALPTASKVRNNVRVMRVGVTSTINKNMIYKLFVSDKKDGTYRCVKGYGTFRNKTQKFKVKVRDENGNVSKKNKKLKKTLTIKEAPIGEFYLKAVVYDPKDASKIIKIKKSAKGKTLEVLKKNAQNIQDSKIVHVSNNQVVKTFEVPNLGTNHIGVRLGDKTISTMHPNTKFRYMVRRYKDISGKVIKGTKFKVVKSGNTEYSKKTARKLSAKFGTIYKVKIQPSIVSSLDGRRYTQTKNLVPVDTRTYIANPRWAVKAIEGGFKLSIKSKSKEASGYDIYRVKKGDSTYKFAHRFPTNKSGQSYNDISNTFKKGSKYKFRLVSYKTYKKRNYYNYGQSTGYIAFKAKPSKKTKSSVVKADTKKVNKKSRTTNKNKTVTTKNKKGKKVTKKQESPTKHETKSTKNIKVGPIKNMKASSVKWNKATIKWDKAKNATKYKVYLKKPSSDKFVPYDSTSTNSITVKGLNSQSSYSVKVEALRSNANTTSASTSFTTPMSPADKRALAAARAAARAAQNSNTSAGGSGGYSGGGSTQPNPNPNPDPPGSTGGKKKGRYKTFDQVVEEMENPKNHCNSDTIYTNNSPNVQTYTCNHGHKHIARP